MKLISFILNIFRFLHISKPEYIYHQNGNYEWFFTKLGPIWFLQDLQYDDSMKELVILVGCPGSGKSTRAKSVYKDYTYINQDSQGPKQHFNKFKEAILSKENVIVDRMNFDQRQRSRYISLAKEHGYYVKIEVLQTPVEECKRRIALRENHETIKTEEDMNNAVTFFINSYKKPQPYEADEIEFI